MSQLCTGEVKGSDHITSSPAAEIFHCVIRPGVKAQEPFETMNFLEHEHVLAGDDDGGNREVGEDYEDEDIHAYRRRKEYY